MVHRFVDGLTPESEPQISDNQQDAAPQRLAASGEHATERLGPLPAPVS